jgi:hypothetical protein
MVIITVLCDMHLVTCTMVVLHLCAHGISLGLAEYVCEAMASVLDELRVAFIFYLSEVCRSLNDDIVLIFMNRSYTRRRVSIGPVVRDKCK